MALSFLDENGDVLNYWPVSGLPEGETSEVLIIQVPIINGHLRASDDARAEVWAKWMMFPANPFIKISVGSGINLNGITGPYSNFSIYVKAIAPIDVFERIPVSVVAAINSPAGWFA